MQKHWFLDYSKYKYSCVSTWLVSQQKQIPQCSIFVCLKLMCWLTAISWRHFIISSASHCMIRPETIIWEDYCSDTIKQITYSIWLVRREISKSRRVCVDDEWPRPFITWQQTLAWLNTSQLQVIPQSSHCHLACNFDVVDSVNFQVHAKSLHIIPHQMVTIVSTLQSAVCVFSRSKATTNWLQISQWYVLTT